MKKELALVFILIFSIILFNGCKTVSDYSKKKYSEAQVYIDKGDIDNAIPLLEDAIKNSPSYIKAYIQLGNCYRKKQEYERAIEYYNKALKIDEENAEAILLKGETYLEMARFLEDKEKRLELYLKAQYQFSKVLEMENLKEEYKFRATLGKGICLLKRTLKEDARKYLEASISFRPNDIRVLFYNALLKEAEMGPNRESLKIYENILKENPNYLEALRQLGDIYKELGLNKRALDYYQKFLNVGGKSPSIEKWVKEELKKVKSKEKEILMVCPECGRIYKKGHKVCDFDGAELVPLENNK